MTSLAPHFHVLHLDTGREWRGGQAQVLNLCRGLKKRDISQTLLCPGGSPLFEKAREAGITVEPFEARGEWNLLAAGRLARRAADTRASLLHAHDGHAHGLARLAIRRRPVPLLVARRVDFPIRQGLLGRFKWQHPDLWYGAISRGVAKVLQKGGVPPQKIRLIPSGVEPDRLVIPDDKQAFRREIHVPTDAPLIGTIGSLVDHKGHRYLIEAAPTIRRSLPEARFVIVGEGPLRQDLERRIAEARLKNVFFLTGFRSDLGAILAALDVFALPSHLEGLCTSLIDAMLHRVPAVGCKTGGVPDLIRHEKTGLLVAPRDPEALAHAIVETIKNPGETAKRVARAREHAMAGFTDDAMVEKTIEVYHEISL